MIPAIIMEHSVHECRLLNGRHSYNPMNYMKLKSPQYRNSWWDNERGKHCTWRRLHQLLRIPGASFNCRCRRHRGISDINVDSRSLAVVVCVELGLFAEQPRAPVEDGETVEDPVLLQDGSPRSAHTRVTPSNRRLGYNNECFEERCVSVIILLCGCFATFFWTHVAGMTDQKVSEDARKRRTETEWNKKSVV